ncbi:MAG TPA: hypothetical protein VF079_05765 [Sphingomicrobium sp.]
MFQDEHSIAGRGRRAHREWWESRWFVAGLMLLSAVPLLYPPVPPLVDLFGHMGRYRVELDLGSSPWLSKYYAYHWAAIGNLGVDLLVLPLGHWLGLEPAVKLIVLAIPPLTVAGFLWVAREVHGRVPPTALFAVPFAYSHPFLYGFLNFALSMALAFLAFGLWLRLARLERIRLRAVLFVPISILVFFTHTFGWGTLGLLCFSAEAVRLHDQGRRWFRAGLEAALLASVMALPILFMLAWRSEIRGGMTFGWFQWSTKLEWLISALRDRWRWFDLGAVALCLSLLVAAWRSRDFTFSRNLAFSALVLVAAFVVIPWTVFSSAFADMRLIPYAIAVALLAIRPGEGLDRRVAGRFALAGLGFVLIRLAGTTASLAIASNDLEAKLAVLDRVPLGARVVNLVGITCPKPWALPRDTHIGGMVIVRREGFSNDQWTIEGQNLMSLRYRDTGPFRGDPSQMVRPAGCTSRRIWPIDVALGALPRGRFDYLWLVDPPPFDPRLLHGAELVARAPESALYRLTPSAAPSPGSTAARAAPAPAR